MLHIIFGQSASGKTTFVKNSFIKNQEMVLVTSPIKHTLVGTSMLVGDYTSDKRCLGTDTLSYTVVGLIKELIKNNLNTYADIVVEGDRINTKDFMEFVVNLKTQVKFYYFTCSVADSVQRRETTGSSGNETFVKTTRTKSNNVLQYLKSLGQEVTIVDTTRIIENFQKKLF